MSDGTHETRKSAEGESGHSRGHRLHAVADLVEIAGQMKASTVIVAGGDRIEDLRLVESARDHGIVDRIILVGQKHLVDRSVRHLKIEIRHDDIVDAANHEEVAAATVSMIKEGGIDIVLKGNISTPVLNRHMLGIASRPTVSLVTIFDAAPIMEGKPVILTDAGFTTVCNFGRMVDLIKNAVEVAHLVMNIDKPRVAVLSANEKQIPSLPSTWMGARLSERNWPDAVVYGPLSFDLATDPGSVTVKGLPHGKAAREVAGMADVLVCPGIDTANAVYKAITAMVKYGQASSASITMGFSIPYIIISRADPLSVRLESIALCSIYSQQRARLRERGETAGSGGPGVAESGEERARKGPVRAPARELRVLVFCTDSKGVRAGVFVNERFIRSGRVDARVGGRGKAEEWCDALSQKIDKWKAGSIDAVATFIPLANAAGAGKAAIYGDIHKKKDRSDAGGAPRDACGLFALSDVVEAVPESDEKTPTLLIAGMLAERHGIPAYVVTPPAGEGVSFCAVQAAARRAAGEIALPIETMNLVVTHFGECVKVAAVSRGNVVDSVSLIMPERGADAGMFDTLINRVAKAIGSMFTVLECDVEAVALSGFLDPSGVFNSRGVFNSGGVSDPAGAYTHGEAVRTLRRRVGRLAPVLTIEGDVELEAVARRALEEISGGARPTAP